jgi:hypothetical protein
MREAAHPSQLFFFRFFFRPNFCHQHRTSHRADNPLGYTSHEKSGQTGTPGAPHCHQAGPFFPGRIDDLFKVTPPNQYRLQRYAVAFSRCFQVLQD